MNGYHYVFMDTDGRTGASLTMFLSSEEAACQLAKELLSKSEFSSLETRGNLGTELIYRIGRTDCID